MHELSITQSVVETIVARTGKDRVVRVDLVIGRLSGVVADSVRFCFDLVTEGTTLERAALAIEEPAGRGHCTRCGAEFDLDDLVLLCGCGSWDVEVVRGTELAIRSVQVA